MDFLVPYRLLEVNKEITFLLKFFPNIYLYFLTTS